MNHDISPSSGPHPPSPSPPRWRGGLSFERRSGVMAHARLIILVVLLASSALTLFLYSPVLRYGFQAFDDDLLVFANPIVVHPSLAMVHRAFTTYDPELYIPLTLVSYQIDSLVGSMRPEFFHATNVLLHLMTGLLMMWWLSLLLRPRFLAVIVGLLFLVHPINTEAVAWIAGRKDLLSGFFAVAVLLSYTRGEQKHDRRLYWLSLELFALALLSKASIVTLPALLLIIDVHMKRTINWDLLRKKIPFAFLSALFIVIAIAGKANTSHTDASIAFLFSGQATFLTFWHAVWPARLSVLYPFDGSIKFSNLSLLLPTLGLWVTAVCTILFKRLRLLAPWLWFFLIAYAPSYFTVMKAGHAYITSDRYGYIALIGIYILITLALHHLVRAWRPSRQIIIFVFVLTLLSLMTRFQVLVWENGVTLFTRALEYAPESLVALNNRAQSFMLQKRYEEAEGDLRRGIEIDPDFPQLHISLAQLLQKKGEMDSARQEFLKALSLDPLNAESHLFIGNFFRAIGDDSEAKSAYSNAYLLNPALIERKLETAGIVFSK